MTPRARPVRVRDLKEAVAAVLESEGRTGEISVALIDDRRIRELNRTYRGTDRPTDVLAFYFGKEDVPGGGEMLGDVVISVDTAFRQAKEYRQTPEKEIALYAVHGTLHLLGYGDECPSARRKMRRKERAIMKSLYG